MGLFVKILICFFLSGLRVCEMDSASQIIEAFQFNSRHVFHSRSVVVFLCSFCCVLLLCDWFVRKVSLFENNVFFCLS
jgi:hypothetical protein